MTKKEEIEVTIKADGQVDLHLVGFGKACDEYIKVFQEILNAQVKDKKFTSEYYSDVKTDQHQRTKF